MFRSCALGPERDSGGTVAMGAGDGELVGLGGAGPSGTTEWAEAAAAARMRSPAGRGLRR